MYWNPVGETQVGETPRQTSSAKRTVRLAGVGFDSLRLEFVPIGTHGEYNPGGGKDEVLKYLEEAKKQVILARGALEKIIKALEL